ncbi:hypothetical protein K432DRAFT_382646, partial [Lepidopterella palustris CBS 459.81]
MCTKELNVKGEFGHGGGDGRISVKEVVAGKVKFESAFKHVKAGKRIKILVEGPS